MKKGFKFQKIKIVCKICNRAYIGYAGFGTHIKNSHQLDARGYFDKTGDPTLGQYLTCEICGDKYFVDGRRGREQKERRTCGKDKCFREWFRRRAKRWSTEGKNSKFEAWSRGKTADVDKRVAERALINSGDNHWTVKNPNAQQILEDNGKRHSVAMIKGFADGKYKVNWPKKNTYKHILGHHHRSDLEAFYCMFLKYHGIDYKYEPKRFPLYKDGVLVSTYTPDLYLPKYDLYIELKNYLFDNAKEKLRLFIENYPDVNFSIKILNEGETRYLRCFCETFVLDKQDDGSSTEPGKIF